MMANLEEKPPLASIPGPNFEISNAAIGATLTTIEDGSSPRSSDELTREFSVVDEPPDGGYGWVQVLAAQYAVISSSQKDVSTNIAY